MSNTVFIFRRDLRIVDNLALIRAIFGDNNAATGRVLPIFILTPTQLDPNKNRFKSDHAVQFMMESLVELNGDLERWTGSRLFRFYGAPDEVVAKILKLKDLAIGRVVVGEDYTPYSRERDDKIAKVCQESGVTFESVEDALLHSVGSIRTGTGSIYAKFTPYFRKATGLVDKGEVVISRPRVILFKKSNFFPESLDLNALGVSEVDQDELKDFYRYNPDNLVPGGRVAGLKILASFGQSAAPGTASGFVDYSDTRDTPRIPTTQLSAYNKFGCVSIREVYWMIHDRLGANSTLIKQLYWRDFYYNILWDHPELFAGGGKALKPKYDRIQWESLDAIRPLWEAWKEGRTGFPFIDAGMRQMNTTGYMHNRLRMNTASFLIKLLMIDWRHGEEYFAQNLLDYDPAVNNGNWQWVAGSGADAQQYNRIFNPWSQSKTHDPDAEYIKTWVPELGKVPARDIHDWGTQHQKYPGIGYGGPIIDYAASRARALERYKIIFDGPKK